ncbi:hypothetical protein L6164_006851 [Bauhinia variegata]|uniref:Uncharacterized protein n=1 Tax=Bauhinia variegata TaxID=167791 RepID=A0ACB9PVP9_BAUVA|nr:hypothetical protein L6164_006851 [Bauhinia variegata]
MALSLETFQSICPSQFISFTIPHPTCPDSLIRVAILDLPKLLQCLSLRPVKVTGVSPLNRVISSCSLVVLVSPACEDEVDDCRKPEFRRRLRFKRMFNLIQTEIRIVPDTNYSANSGGIGEVEVAFVPDLRVLVHPYLAPMVASLSLISEYIEGRIQHGFRPKSLCLGVGGRALLSFLRNQLGFEVMGIDADQEVLRVAKHYFGLEHGEFMHITVGDAVKSLKKLPCLANCSTSAACELKAPDVNNEDISSHISNLFGQIPF